MGEKYLPEDTVGFIIGIDEHYYEVVDNGSSIKKAADLNVNYLEEIDDITVSNTDVHFYRYITPANIPSVIINDEKTTLTSENVTDYFDFVNSKLTLKTAYTTTVTDVILPDTVTIGDDVYTEYDLGDKVFINCTNLKSVVISSSVRNIGKYAFQGCRNLESVTIPEGVTTFNTQSFYGCSSLKSTVIPSTVTALSDSLFNGCSSMTSITLPDTLTTIGNYVFKGCKSLTSITIPASVTSIGNYTVFEGCSGLTSIVVESGNTVYDSRNNCNAIIKTSTNALLYGCQNTIIPNNVTSIGYSAFKDCTTLTIINIPASVTSIGNYPFAGCSALTSMTVDSGNTKYDSRDNCNAIILKSSNSLIAGCQTTTIPATVKSIGSNAFYGITSITSIVIPDTVTSIGSNAFYDCKGLTSITLSANITSIGQDTFRGCSVLTHITIPDKVTTIQDRAFESCPQLRSVVIPEKNTTIRPSAFNSSRLLSAVYYKGTAEKWSSITIGSNNNYLNSATKYYYTETAPTGSGNYWHYVDGVITIWD